MICAFREKHALKVGLKMYTNPHLYLTGEVPPMWMATKSKWGTLMSTFLFNSECWDLTHWYIDYCTFYTLNPHNETQLLFQVCTLRHTHTCMGLVSRDSLPVCL